MKNQLIISLWNAVLNGIKREKGYKNSIKSVVVLGLLFSTGFFDIAAMSKKKQQGAKKAARQPRKKVASTPQPAGPAGLVAKKTITAEEFTNLYIKLEPLLPTRALNLIEQIRARFDLSPNQKIILDKLAEKKRSAKVKRMQVGKIAYKPLVQPSLKQEKAERTKDGGWFSKLWDYETSLTQYLPSTAFGGAVTALAAYFALPAVAGYLTLGLAAKLGVLAFGADRIYYSYNQGKLTETEAINDLKQLVSLELADGGRYPTLKSREEALQLMLEFPGIKEKSRIGRIVLQELRAENSKALGALKSAPAELQQEEAISIMIDQLRDEFDFSLTNPENYIEQLESPKKFIVDNMNDDNAMVIIRAICSELLRMKTIVAVRAAASVKQEVESEEAPGFMQKASQWWYGKPTGEEKAGETGTTKEEDVNALLEGL
jgi:hypothetical protein